MHEYSIVAALLERVSAEARARNAVAVHRVTVAIGEGAGVEPELLSRAYQTFRTGTICAGAELHLRRVEQEWACPGCGRRIARGEILECRECGRGARMVQGDEIVLERIEIEVA